jgi:xanthine dehydrogenase accessory factor
MVVFDDDERGRAAGTLGGGCVEADAILAGREAIRTGVHSLRAYELTEDLAWNTGLVCGGTMWILVEPGETALRVDDEDVLEMLEGAAGGGRPAAVVTLLQRATARSVALAGRLLVTTEADVLGSLGAGDVDRRAIEQTVAQLPHGTPRLFPFDDTHDLLVEPVVGRPGLVIAGGGHVAQAIARQARLLDFDVTILEDRPEFADPARFDGARVIAGDIVATIAALEYGWSSYLVIATRGHKLDADCVRAAVGTNVRYIGLLGSRRKTILIDRMLQEHGVAEARRRAIHAPVGLDLGGRTPAEIALSVLAEITQIRYQGTGRQLSVARSGT